MLGDINKFFIFQSLLTTTSSVLPLQQTFPPIVWIFTESEGDGIQSRLPFKIFSTLMLPQKWFSPHCDKKKRCRRWKSKLLKRYKSNYMAGQNSLYACFFTKKTDHFMSVLIKIRLKSGRLIFDFPFNVQFSKIYNWSSNFENFIIIWK